KGTQKVTRAEIDRRKEQEAAAAQKRRAEKKKEEEESPLEENVNHLLRKQRQEADLAVDARSLTEAIDQITVEEEDKHPEKRMKAAYLSYESQQLPMLRYVQCLEKQKTPFLIHFLERKTLRSRCHS